MEPTKGSNLFTLIVPDESVLVKLREHDPDLYQSACGRDFIVWHDYARYQGKTNTPLHHGKGTLQDQRRTGKGGSTVHHGYLFPE